MNINYINTFLVVAKEGSMSKAAPKLFMTAAGTKKQIDYLEAEMGTRLYSRSNQGMTLTVAGEYFYNHVKKLHSSWNDLEHQMKHFELLENIDLIDDSSTCSFAALDYLMLISDILT